MKKSILALLLSMLISFALTSTSAITHADEDTDNSSYSQDEDDMVKKKKGEYKEKMGKLREKRDGSIKVNRMEMKENRKDLRTEKKDNMWELKELLTTEEAAAMKALHEEKKASMEDNEKMSKQDYKKLSDEEKEVIKEEKKTKMEAHMAKVKEILANNPEALKYIEEKHAQKAEMKTKHKELRDENMQSRKDFREKRGTLVDTYKKAFIKRLWNRLDKIEDSKLEKVLDKIDTIEVAFEAKTNMSDERKTKILSQIQALREMIEDRLETSIDEEIDEDDILDA